MKHLPGCSGSRHVLALILALAAQAWLLPGSQAQTNQSGTVAFNDFSDTSALQLNGSAASATTADGHVLQLTPATFNQAGSTFLRNPVSLGTNVSFSTFFSFRLSRGGGGTDVDGVPGADGIVFVVQSVANNVGSLGGGIGYLGISNSVSVEFDTWYNNGNPTFDPQLPNGQQNPNGSSVDGNHIAIGVNGALDDAVETHIATPLNNGNVWYAWVDYNGATGYLEVRLSQTGMRPSEPTLTNTVNLLDYLGTTNAYFGFTAATGGAYNQQDILAWQVNTQYQPIGVTITTQPTNQTRTAGTTATFVVSAAGDPSLSYQWLFGGTNLTDNNRISGSQSNNLIINSVFVSDAGDYSVVVSNNSGAVHSLTATLTVQPPPQQKIVYGNDAGSGQDIVHKIDFNSGTDIQTYAVSAGNGRGVVVVGNIIYSTQVRDPHIYKTDATTGASLGSILTDKASLSTLAWDGSAFWTTDYSGTNEGYQIDLTGTTIKTVRFPLAVGFMDGMEYFNGKLIVNRYDDGVGPGGTNYYDIYDLDGNVLTPAFITITDGTGIAYDGTNFLVSRVHNNAIDVFDGTTGAFIQEKVLTGAHLIEDLSVDYAQRPDTSIHLSPATATNQVGAAHTVCATITSGTNPVAGTTVTFNVTNGPNATVHGTSVTDSNGIACFTYVGNGGPGTDTIDVSFVDSQGSRQSTSATKVWVAGSNRPPVALCTNVTVSAGSNCMASGSIDNASFDPDDDKITLVQVPPGPYPIGSNNVCLIVNDSHGASNACCAVVFVVDTTAPQILCPANMNVAEAPRDSGFATVTFPAPSATDVCDNNLLVYCTPPSGSIFPVGTNTVSCTGVDHSGNTNTCTFTIRVIPYRLPVTVTSTADSGPGTLREALLDANDSPDENLVVFNLPGPDPGAIYWLVPAGLHWVPIDRIERQRGQ